MEALFYPIHGHGDVGADLDVDAVFLPLLLLGPLTGGLLVPGRLLCGQDAGRGPAGQEYRFALLIPVHLLAHPGPRLTQGDVNRAVVAEQLLHVVFLV